MSILRDGSDQYSAYSHSDSALTLYPVIVLVDPYSASASEIIASTIQSYRAGIVVGTRTYGKGVAQIVVDQNYMPDYFPDGDAIKITAYRFILPTVTPQTRSVFSPNFWWITNFPPPYLFC